MYGHAAVRSVHEAFCARVSRDAGLKGTKAKEDLDHLRNDGPFKRTAPHARAESSTYAALHRRGPLRNMVRLHFENR